jgi:hypothetical protein
MSTLLGKFAKGGVVEPFFDEQVQRLVEDPLPCGALTHHLEILLDGRQGARYGANKIPLPSGK